MLRDAVQRPQSRLLRLLNAELNYGFIIEICSSECFVFSKRVAVVVEVKEVEGPLIRRCWSD